MSFERISFNHQHLTLWLINDQGVVFHQGQQSLYVLEPISVALLFAMDDGASPEQAISLLQEYNTLSYQQILPFVEQVQALLVNNKSDKQYLDHLYPELQNHIKQAASADDLIVMVGASRFAISSDNASLFSHIKALLRPISQRVDIDADKNLQIDFKLHIQQEHDVYSLISNGLVVEENLTYNQAMPVFIDRLQILSYQQSNYLYGFHGGALTLDVGNKQPLCILLPGISGAGKSTLTAELANHGFTVHSDEVISIDAKNRLQTLNLPMAIKSGSWPHLSGLYPQLNDQPIWHRADGRLLKYIWPNQNSQQNDEPNCTNLIAMDLTNTFVICPRFASSDLAQISTLSVIDVLKTITQSGYQLGAELTIERVQQLIDFCATIDRKQITYINSQQSLQFIDDICGLKNSTDKHPNNHTNCL